MTNNNEIKTMRLVEQNGIIRFSENEIKTLDSLSMGTYQLSFHNSYNEQYFYLQKIPDLFVSDNLGDIDYYTEKILKSYQEKLKNNKSMGVLFSGLPGTGKTYTLKYTVIEISKQLNLPVIIINSSLPINPEFYSIMNTIHAIIVIDEFEKIYPTTEDDMDSDSSDISSYGPSGLVNVGIARKDRFVGVPESSINKGYSNYQAGFLTLLDGTSCSKNLYLFTCNGRVSKYLMSRPGRIKYCFSFNKLNDTVIKNFINKKLNEQDKQEEVYDTIKKISSILTNFSFDILETIVDEYNIYGVNEKTEKDILNILNIGLEKKLEFSVIGIELADGKTLSDKYFYQYSFDTLGIPSYVLFTKDIFIRCIDLEFKFSDFVLEYYSDIYNDVIHDETLHLQDRNLFDKYTSISLENITVDKVEFLENNKIKLLLKEPLDMTDKFKRILNKRTGMFESNKGNFEFIITSILLTKNNLTSFYEAKRELAFMREAII